MNFLLSMSKFLLDAADVAEDVTKIIKMWIGPLFVALGGVGGVYVIILAVQYVKAESDSKRAEAKNRIINCVIGVVTLLVLGFLMITIDLGAIAKVFGYASKDW